MQSMKETVSNVAASAKAGMEKTKAAAQEKAEKMSAHDPVQKEMATEKKEERMARADLHKEEARERHMAAKHARESTGARADDTTGPDYMTSQTRSHSVTGQPGYPTGTHQMSGMPGHGTGAPYGGMVEEGVATAHPSGQPGRLAGHNPRVEGYPATGMGATRVNEPGYVAPPGPRTGGGTY